ncbi:MAG: TrmH family RNA methyltransferase [Treponemataceae bacterium]|nr:TrmH family RNA methyltransferase [Treponemataceae bacterium]
MIPPNKLFELEGGQRRRKLALCFGALERDIAGIAEKGSEYAFHSMTRLEYTKKLVSILCQDPQLPEEAKSELKGLMEADPVDERRLCNCARNHLLAIIGTFPAEWDLVIAPHSGAEEGTVQKRDFYPGLYVYAEDIRSPFNLGSIFRTAEAMGVEKVFISPFCVDPNHPRAIRSGMGCIENLSWERLSLDELVAFAEGAGLPIFALETGGTPLDEFEFPKKGIVIIGSEELGISPSALQRATYGTATIPMKGIKSSLNVGVAFGILMQSWVSSLS